MNLREVSVKLVALRYDLKRVNIDDSIQAGEIIRHIGLLVGDLEQLAFDINSVELYKEQHGVC